MTGFEPPAAVGAANSPKIDLLTRPRNQKILTPCLSSSVWTSLMSTSEVVFPDWDQKDKTFFARYDGTVNTYIEIMKQNFDEINAFEFAYGFTIHCQG